MTRKTINRRRVLAGTGAGITAAVAGCIGGGSGDEDDVHFITDYYNDTWEAHWGDLEEEFEGETEIGINIEEGGMSGTQEGRLAQLIQAGEPPDANTSTLDQVADIYVTGQLEPVDDIVAEIEEVNGPLNTDAYLGDDGVYQIPHGHYVSNFQYRADIYEELGLEPPENFQDIIDNARAIDESDLDVRGYGLAGMPTGKSQDEYLIFAASAGIPGLGIRWKDPDAREEYEIYFPEEEVTMILDVMKQLAEYSPDPTSIGWAESLSQWLQGEYAQCYHLNAWPVGIAALQAEAQDSDPLRGLAEATQVRAFPTWEEIDKEENWFTDPTPDGYHIFSGGDNTEGAREWFKWLYADSIEKTASFYETEPGRFLPTYENVLESDAFQNIGLFQAHPHLLEKLEYVQNEIWANHYGNVDEANLDSPVALYLARQWFYGEMVNNVVTDSMTVQEAYEWGRGELEDAFATAQEDYA